MSAFLLSYFSTFLCNLFVMSLIFRIFADILVNLTIQYMLLQKNIVKKYLNMLNEEQMLKPWQQYQSYFLNEDIQANIHKIKEEQFQEGFLRELFVKVLGYTINPSPIRHPT